MKRASNGCVLSFLAFAFSLTLSSITAAQEPSPEQLQAFRAAKSVRIAVEVSGIPPDEKFVQIFQRIPARLLAYAGIASSAGAPEDHTTLQVTAKFQGLSARYSVGGIPEAPGAYLEAGMAIDGEISLMAPHLPAYTKRFAGRRDPPDRLPSFEDRRLAACSGPASFFSTLLEMLGTVYGWELVVSAAVGYEEGASDYPYLPGDAVGVLRNHLGDGATIEALASVLKHAGDSSSRRRAATRLGELGDPRAVEPLIAALNDPEPVVVAEAAGALANLGDPHVVEPLIQVALRPGHSVARTAAINALGKFRDPRAIEPLIALLRDEDPGVFFAALWTLEDLGDRRAVEPLIQVALGRDSVLGPAAIDALGQLRDSRAIEPLIALLGDIDNISQVIGAARALERITGEQFGTDREKWQAWWEENKATVTLKQ